MSGGCLGFGTPAGGANKGLHPELQARLQRMGIGINSASQGSMETMSGLAGFTSDAAPKATPTFTCVRTEINALSGEGKSRGSSSGAEGKTPRKPPQMPGGPSAMATSSLGKVTPSPSATATQSADHKAEQKESLDELLLQLDDLDARNKALQKGAKADEAEAKKAARRAAREARAANASPRTSADEGVAAIGADTAAGTVVKQHPLEGLHLGVADDAGTTFRWHRTHRDRPPVVPGTPTGKTPSGKTSMGKTPKGRSPRKPHSIHLGSTAMVSSGFTQFPDSPSSARGMRGEKGSCVKLPNLKTSSSAPGCLMSTTGLRSRNR